MNIDLIISRYNENLNWVHRVASNIDRIYLYDKGVVDSNIGAFSIKLPNVGREAHTFLHHIISQYDNLGDYNAFCQGDPIPHGGDQILHTINSIKKKTDEFDFLWLSNGLFVCDKMGLPQHSGLNINDFLNRVGIIDVEDNIAFAPGAQFIVNKKLILRHPKSFYEKLITQFDDNLYLEDYRNKDICDGRPYYTLACIFERIWEKIFKSNLNKI